MSENTSSGLTSEEINTLAEKYKNEGNAFFKQGKNGYTDALRLYQRALDLNCTDDKVNAACHGNMAAAFLNLEKYAECVDHAKKSLAIDNQNVKVYWRAARASFSLELWKNSIDFCNDGLKVQADNEDLIKCKESAQQRLARAQASHKERDEAEARRREKEAANDVPEVTFDADEAEDLQAEINNLAKQVAAFDAEVAAAKRRSVKAELTAQELINFGLKDNAVEPPLFMQHGKAFFKTTRANVDEWIASEKEKAAVETPKAEEKRDLLEKRVLEKENRLRGMVKNMQRRQAEGERVLPTPVELAARREAELKNMQQKMQN
eukprot:GDKJ01034072.1.p1 GENE.GDKJ01034072.1~~GDKJ01034072.1.p1  ORF type:complete len:321 (+),score=104.59 GDKJ01034072.1:27-989(+)